MSDTQMAQHELRCLAMGYVVSSATRAYIMQGCHRINHTSIKLFNLNQSEDFSPINQTIVDNDIIDLFDDLLIHRVGETDPQYNQGLTN